MQIKTHTNIIKILLFLLVAIVALTGCGRNNMNFDFAEVIDGENLDDISLTIYYMEVWTLTPIYVTVEMLREGWYANRIVVTGNDLKDHIYLFKQINKDTLIPMRGRPTFSPDIRLYYILESNINGKLFDVAMWGGRVGMIFNGIEVEANPIFYDIILPFLPSDMAAHIERARDAISEDSN